MHQVRKVLLMTVAIATSLVIVKSVVAPTVETQVTSNYVFPKTVPLPEWTLVARGPVNPNLVQPPAYLSGDFISGKRYQYRPRDGALGVGVLDIEMRYLAHTNGDLKNFLTQKIGELLPALREDKNGFYALFSIDDTAYLSTCINPQGGSTISSDQFHRNRMLYDTRLKRILPWFLGRARVHDQRCLWAHLSIPINSERPQADAYQTLEEVWGAWFAWWQVHFPRP